MKKDPRVYLAHILESGVLQNGLVQVFVHGTGPSKIP